MVHYLKTTWAFSVLPPLLLLILMIIAQYGYHQDIEWINGVLPATIVFEVLVYSTVFWVSLVDKINKDENK